MITELGRLQISIEIGNIRVNRCPGFAIQSSRYTPVTTCRVRLQDINSDLLGTIEAGDAATITIGYAKRSKFTWDFIVETIHEIGKNMLDIQLVEDDIKLKRYKVKKTWENTTPATIVRSIIEEAGFSVGSIENIPVALPKFIVGSKTAWDTVKQLERTLRISFGSSIDHLALWRDSKGRFNWNAEFEMSDTLNTFEIGKGVLQHHVNHRLGEIGDSGNPLNCLETFLIPELRHSQNIRISDVSRGVSGEFPIIDVKHQFVGDSAGTFINYLPGMSDV